MRLATVLVALALCACSPAGDEGDGGGDGQPAPEDSTDEDDNGAEDGGEGDDGGDDDGGDDGTDTGGNDGGDADDGGASGGDDGGTGSGDSSDGEECPDFSAWDNGCELGEVIANWAFVGFADVNGNHVIDAEEEQDTQLDMDTIRCAGAKSVVFLGGDTNCSACPEILGAVAELQQDIRDANGLIFTNYALENGDTPLPTSQALNEAVREYGVEPDYVSGEYGFPPDPCKGSLPLSIVIDLETMAIEWVHYGWYGGGEKTIADDILLVVQAIDS
jgi:hypothetical protein